jgi:glutamine cyclotransferase
MHNRFMRYLITAAIAIVLLFGASLAYLTAQGSQAGQVNIPLVSGSGGSGWAGAPQPSATPTPLPPTVLSTPVVAPTSAVTPTATLPPAAPVYSYTVVNSYPHDPAAFTQGLVYADGLLYEGTGRRGQSTLRRVELETGTVLEQVALEPEYFGEGIALFGDTIFQLTWQANVGFRYERESFTRLGEFTYPTEGWGLTHDGERLIMSDGTATLYFRDPATFAELGRVAVTDATGPVTRLNELEYIQGEVYANVWQTDRVARIDPATGQVTAWIDLSGLLSPEDRQQPVDVLNGIAYDAANDRLFVTGKLWPKLFEIDLVAPE